MLEIKGRFKCGQIKDIGTSQVMTLVNSDKDKEGNYQKAYYQIFLSEKAKSMFTIEMKRKIKDLDQYLIIDIEGYLKVSYNNKFTNLIIILNKISEYLGGGNNNATW